MDPPATDTHHNKDLEGVKGGRKRGRRKVAIRKKVKGRKKSVPSSMAEAAEDLAECIFSDEEMREEFLTETQDTSDGSASVNTSEASLRSPSPTSSYSESSSTLHDSRSSSSCSTVTSSASSRPTSAMSSETPDTSLTGDTVLESSVQCSPSLELIELGLNKFKCMLPKPWFSIADQCGFHLLLPSLKGPVAIQREIFISFGGSILIYLHRAPVPDFSKLFGLESKSQIVYKEAFIDKYCDLGLQLVKRFLQFDTCVGANHMESRKVWYMISDSYIDLNPYQESKFQETCRSLSCLKLIELGHGKRCKECTKVMKSIIERKDFLLSETFAASSNNQSLTHEQSLLKLKLLGEEIQKKDKKIAWLKKRIGDILTYQGVNIEDGLSESFSAIIMASPKLTDTQKWFLQEQWSRAHKSDSRAHRWHPTMIRLALHLQWSKGYDALRDLGVIGLPCRRTLYDYSHAIKATDGINEGIVQIACEMVKSSEQHQKFHVLLCDGMHISQNLVYKKADGRLVGYTHLQDAEKEMESFENYINGKEPVSSEPILATEMLAYLVKGMASKVKFVIASYPCKVLTREMLYTRSWEVIRILEKSGLKVLVFVCDGFAVNRAFMRMHSPISTVTEFGVIYDTVNFCSPELRPLYFVSDVCHLLKTLRNAFYNSGEGEKKPRQLVCNGEKIEWKTIVRLYLTYKQDTFRKTFKLNAQNVFPNSYSKMKVRYAAHVLSNTTAQDLEDQHWAGTTETVKFIRMCNKFFDTLNGAHSSQAGRSANSDLAPYTDVNDARFDWLLNVFLKYIVDWKKQVDALPMVAKEKEKLMLPSATYEGIEISIRGIIGATKYFLDKDKGNGKFVMARIYSQDPLEQHFAKQRMSCGGSRNPNSAQFEQQQVSSAIQRDLGFRARRGNATETDDKFQITDEPLPKRKKR